ncbi:hypothetical protein M8C21_022513 [Ambrosia artemisiifolia]|uniref:Uncharacterized protein n=1 Tax=Ambrosia artemisiifolia TaxID=4212 RepID=A0AAD5BPH2_AMBAR|nr:hypothetical protein M8C21_022513 [Ambrosia artemisiifolia]
METMQEVRAVMDVASARNLMGELHVLLNQWKDTGEINKAQVKKDKAPMESHMTTMHEQGEAENHRPQQDTEMKNHFLESMTHIENYWEDLSERVEIGRKKTHRVISMLRSIEELLKKLPGSHQAKLQARYSGLRSEAETVMEYMMDRMKFQCDKKPSFFNERATSSQQCSSS